MPKENIYNLPNFLSFYRLLSFPFLLYLIYSNNEFLFSILLCFNLITDIVDGLIARAFNLRTELGARLDSIADLGTYILAFTGIIVFKLDEMQHVNWILWIYVSLVALDYLVALIKFQKLPSLHLYSSKIGGYAQGIFFFVLFAYGYVNWLFYIAIIIGVISFIEQISVLIYLPEMKSDVKGIYWLLKKQTN